MSSRILIRSFAAAVLVAAAAYAGVIYLRPTAVVVPVARDTAVDTAPATLTVLAETREIRCEMAGRIADDMLEVGRAVAAGEVLVQLDTTALEIEIEQIQGRIATARAKVEIGPASSTELENAQAALTEMENQEKSGQVPRNSVDRQRRVVAGLEKKVALEKVGLEDELARQEADLKAKKNVLERMTLRSPIDGVIAQVLARKGDLVNGGSTVAEIIANTRTVQGQVAEDYFAGIKVGQEATVRLANWGEEKFYAKVSKVLPASDPQTKRYLVELDVLIEKERLVPGVTGEAVIILDQRPDALIVPRPAVIGKRVFVVSNGNVEIREVETGYSGYAEIEVRSGLREGELVIVDSLDLFREGQRVNVELPSDAKR